VIQAAAAARPRLGERIRVETLVPLLVAYFALAVLYAWQAWRREVPSIFTDELEMTQISRSIADTGLPGRRGESHGFTTLVPWLTAPGWWIGDTETAYATVKYLQTLVMATALLPAYLLARMVVSHPWAMFAAVATIAAPALSYAPMLVEEPFAYPAATLALWLLVRMAAHPTWGSFALAAGACVLATAIRSQLVALFPVLLVPLLVLGWRSEPMRRYRKTWSRWDWVGAVTLAIGALLLTMAFIGHQSADWATTMAFWKGRIVEYGLWAAGAFAIGVGVFPLVAALAALVRPREELRDPRTLGYVLVSGSALFFLGFYGGMKGAYVSTVLGSYVVERNLVYLAPVAFVSTALLLERRNPRWWAVAAATALVLYLVVDTPMRLDQYPYYEAHGLAILAFANRVFAWPETAIQTALVGVTLASGGVLLALGLLRGRRRAVTGIVVAVVALVLAWNLMNEIYSANGERRLSRRLAANFVEPRDWIDRAVGDGTVTVVGQQFVDASGIWLTEFFNRSVKRVWSVDPSSAAPPPGPTVTADLTAPDGTMAPEPGTGYALAVNGVRLQGDPVARLPDGQTALYRLDGPLRLAENQTGVYGDGWMGSRAAYNRFDVTDDGPGFARVTLSREAFCPVRADGTVVPLPSRMRIRIGPLGVGRDKQPTLASTSETRELDVQPCKAQTVLIRPPDGPWRVEVAADTFVPAEVDPNLGDRRQLGARVDFGFTSL
jgi:hypothetical protein